MRRLFFRARLRLSALSDRLLDLTPERITFIGAELLALMLFLSFVAVVVFRITYPFDLEWMEGGVLTHSQRLLDGEPIYAAPSADFIAYIYQPLYSIVVAGIGAVTGLSLLTARLLSVICTALLAVLLLRCVRHETGAPGIALLATGMFFGLYPLTGYWFDLARVDSFFLVLVMGGLYVARYQSARAYSWPVATLLLTAAYFTKQTAVLFIPLTTMIFLSRRKSHGVAHLLTCVSLITVTTLISDAATHGWYTYYVHYLVSGEPYMPERLKREFWVKAATDLPVVMGGFVAWSLMRLGGVPLRRLAGEVWLLATWVGMVAALLTWSRPGGFINNFLPFYYFALIPAAQALHAAFQAQRRSLALAAILLGVLQLASSLYDPRPQQVTALDREAGDRFVERVVSIAGPVLIPEHPWYGVLAGKEPSYQTMGLVDLQYKEGRQRWPEDLRERLRTQHYTAVITSWEADRPTLGSYPPELEAFYRPVEVLTYPDPAILRPKTGTWSRPTFVYRPILPSWQSLNLTTDFEDGTYRGWFASGDAFGDRPATGPFPGQLEVVGHSGLSLVNSFIGSSDQAMGELETPWFRLNARKIRFKVGGGADVTHVGVQLWTDRGLQRSAAGRNTEVLDGVEWDVSDLLGQVVQLRVVDQSNLGWGHVLFDDLELE